MTRRARIGLLVPVVTLAILGGCAPTRTAADGRRQKVAQYLSQLPRVLDGTGDDCEPVVLTSLDAIAIAKEYGLPEGVHEWRVVAQLCKGRCAWVVTSSPTQYSSWSFCIDSETGEVLSSVHSFRKSG
jgi:hypothetical protein